MSLHTGGDPLAAGSKDMFGPPGGMYMGDGNMTMDLLAGAPSTSDNMCQGVPHCGGYDRYSADFFASSNLKNNQMAPPSVGQANMHPGPMYPVNPIKSEDAFGYPESCGVNTAMNSEPIVITPCSPDMTLFSPEQVDSLFNKLCTEEEAFKCFTCSVKSNYEEQGKDLFRLKLAMCIDPAGGFHCPVCDIKFRLPTPLEHHLNMHCSTGDGVNVRCILCGDKHHVLIPNNKQANISCSAVAKNTSECSGSGGPPQEEMSEEMTADYYLKQEDDADGRMAKRKQGKPKKCSGVSEPKFNPQDCQVCGKHFNLPDSLMAHMRTHAGQKPYVCQTCGKSFTTSSHCRSHQAVHNANLRPQCKICGKILSRQEALKRHMRIHSGEKPYPCVQCDKKFRSPSDLRAHEAVHHGAGADKELLCPVCGKNFNRRDNLTVHLRSHTGERPYGCDVCDKRFVTKTHLKNHQLTHTDIRDVPCPVCQKMFRRKETMKKHLRCHTTVHPYLCDNCGKGFSNRGELQAHLISHGDSRWNHVCQVCGKILSNRDVLKRHMLIHSGEKPYPCTQCGKCFRSPSNLRSHEVAQHNAAPDRVFSCPVCNKTFKRRENLKIHIRSHTGERPYGCEICDKRFVTRTHLKNHQLTHTDVRDIPCPVCHKMFRRKWTMVKHLRRHGGGYTLNDSMTTQPEVQQHEKLMKCDYCLIGFVKAVHLRQHIRIMHKPNTQNKMYPCPVCSKLFASKPDVNVHIGGHEKDMCYKCNMCRRDFLHRAHLISHMNNHQRYKPYQCRTCGKAFIFSCNLRKHVKKHTGGIPYCCQYCGKTFCHKLLEHMRVHTGNKPYLCSTCGKHFRKRESRDFHMFSHTGIKPYTCEMCMKGFANAEQIRRHQLTHKLKNEHFLVALEIPENKFMFQKDVEEILK